MWLKEPGGSRQTQVPVLRGCCAECVWGGNGGDTQQIPSGWLCAAELWVGGEQGFESGSAATLLNEGALSLSALTSKRGLTWPL